MKAGQMLQLIIPYEGRPLPEILWKKQEPPKKGWEFLDPEVKDLPSHAIVKNNQFQTILTVRNSSMDDSGKYKLSVQVGDQLVDANIDVFVIDTSRKGLQNSCLNSNAVGRDS